MVKIPGRPKGRPEENKTAEIKIRCLLQEKEEIIRRAKTYGLTVTDYVLKKCLDKKIVFNHIEIVQEIHQLNLEMARAGNNINQLAKYANTLQKVKRLKPEIANRLNTFMTDYLQKQDEIRKVFRKLTREMSKP
ncbi:MAG: plasmid mobilization relaxosome protein MobC [Mangrovibacterium sp.]